MEQIIWAIEGLSASSIIDILLVTFVLFGLSFLVRGAQGVTLLRGFIIVYAVAVIVSNLLNLTAMRWLLQNLITLMAVAIPVIFQPELRRVLERLGRAGAFNARLAPDDARARIIETVAQAAERLSERRHGALIVLERGTALGDYMRTGVPLDSEVSPQLLLTIFWPKTELHDGAVIVTREGRVAAAAAVLPLSSSRSIALAGQPKLGTRHRAALGMSEVSDAVVVVVSEETGRITLATGGRLITKLDGKRLRTVLAAFFSPARESTTLLGRLRDQFRLLLGQPAPAEGQKLP